MVNSVPIRSYVKIRGDAHPYDPWWEVYLEAWQRWRMEQTLPGQQAAVVAALNEWLTS
jgi:hypothetical protein